MKNIIQGLIEAKKFGVSKSSCPIVCFWKMMSFLMVATLKNCYENSDDDGIIVMQWYHN